MHSLLLRKDGPFITRALLCSSSSVTCTALSSLFSMSCCSLYLRPSISASFLSKNLFSTSSYAFLYSQSCSDRPINFFKKQAYKHHFQQRRTTSSLLNTISEKSFYSQAQSAHFFPSSFIQSRTLSMMADAKNKALLLGTFDNPDDKESFTLSPNASKLDSELGGKISQQINVLGPLRKGKIRVFYSLSQEYPIIGVVGLGPKDAGINQLEEIDERKENIRTSIAVGVRHLRELGSIGSVEVDPCTDARSAAEGASLGIFYFDSLKSKKYKKTSVSLSLFAGEKSEVEEWTIGSVLASGQNLCRDLEETPANLMTPTVFAKIASEKLSPLGVTLHIRDKAWAESQKMGSFLSVAKGSDQPPVFLEMHYNNAPKTKPIVFVGKGITFDSGGISLKSSANMDRMRGDMGGAANVLSTIFTLASLKAPVNIIGLTPLCENLPSGTANKPGDVVTAMNGKTIQVDNTDAEGRLILADALCYAHSFDPLLVLDIATLTGSQNVAMGSSATGVFTTTKKYWEVLHDAGVVTGDRMWRMPLWNHFTKQTTDSQLADLQNVGKVPSAGGCCIAAAFLKEFVTHPSWLHLDIAGVMDNRDEVGYLGKGMSGRPLRTLVKFAEEIYEKQLF